MFLNKYSEKKNSKRENKLFFENFYLFTYAKATST